MIHPPGGPDPDVSAAVTRRIVLDASAALEAVLVRPRAPAVLNALEEAAIVLAPDLFFAEVANSLWKYVRGGHIDVGQVLEYYETAAALVDRTLPAADLAHEAITEAARHTHPVYDMLYAVVARRFGCAVCTVDRRLASALGQMEIPALLPAS